MRRGQPASPPCRPARRCAAHCRAVALALVLLAAWAAPAAAQFGQNKVQYRRFRWHVLETAHFQIHYYEQERPAALEAARMAERSYAYLKDFYQHDMEDRIPLILYSSHQDFEQSNVIAGFISEGTGGVTESLKGRVTLPLTGSYAELNHVLTHELVHAFQFDIAKRNMRGMLGMGTLPLWMMEGMAEWVSNGMDPVTSMWIVDAVHRHKLPTVAEMARLQDIRVYRMGQALFQVIADEYGEERVRRILRGPETRRDPKFAPRDSLYEPNEPPPTSAFGRDSPTVGPDSTVFAPGAASTATLDKAWRAWADSLAHTLGHALVNPDSVAKRLTPAGKYGRSFHLAPVISPDGQRVLYYSSRGLHNELFLAERKGDSWVSRSLVSGEETPALEALPLLSASADWAPDGEQIVFVGTERGQDVLQIYDLEKRRIVRRLRTELMSVNNPSWSPDGRFLVFSGLEGGQEDLFLVELQSGQLTRLTQDAYAERTPRFSPQGDALLFATDRGPATDLRALQFGSWNIARMELRREGDRLMAGNVEVAVESPANDFAPQWGPDGSSIAFISDRDGTYQVYTLDLGSGAVRQRTRFDAGVVGIVPTGPAFSWAKSNDVVFSVFHNGGWTLYGTHGFPADDAGEVQTDRLALTRSAPEAIGAAAATGVLDKDRPYRARLTPEYAVLGGLYIGNGGAAGSGQLLLGDMLGNHYLYLSAFIRSQIDQSEFLLQYADLSRRWMWGTAVYQFRDELGLFTAPDSIQFSNRTRFGVLGEISYPFDRFRRVDFSLDLQTVNDETASVLFSTGEQLAAANSRVYYVIPGISYVRDTSAYSGFTPIAGGRFRIGVEQALGNIDYSFGVLDWRRYLNYRTRSALALRLIAAGSAGPDKQRLRLGGPDTFRGADYGALVGSRAVLTNAEFRFPLIPTTELLRGVVFVDAASVWWEGFPPTLTTRGGPLGFSLNDLQLAYGFGFRAFVGLPLRIDFAFPTNLAVQGDMRTLFAIGWDF